MCIIVLVQKKKDPPKKKHATFSLNEEFLDILRRLSKKHKTSMGQIIEDCVMSVYYRKA